MERILAIQDHEGLCWNCLQDKSNIQIIKIHEMGYGSKFDGKSTEIHLCDECYQESIKDDTDLWSMEEIQCEWDKEDNNGFTEYKHEDKMIQYINNLPIQGKQFVQNEFANGWNAGWLMSAQDWIDYQLDMLSHDKCKEYMLYSPEEINAYKERFPTCQYPTNKIYSENSKSCWCPFDASGGYGQKCDDNNISCECYECQFYTKRTTPIKDINKDDFDDYMLYLKAQMRQEEWIKKYGA